MPFSKKVIDAIQLPIVIFSAGYIREVGSPQMCTESKKSIAYLNKKAALVGIRDSYTKSFLIRHGVPAKKIQLIGDSAILLSEIEPSAFPFKPGIKIGLNLNYSGWLGFGKWSTDILNAYKNIAEYFIKNHNAHIYYLKHHPGEDNIYPALNTPMTLVDFLPHEQKYVYGRLDLIIGMMLHSCVMSFGAGTPEINVAYDIRNKNFAKFIGCPELVVSLEKLKSGTLEKRAQHVFEHKEIYKQKFSKKIKKIQQKHTDFLNQIENILMS